MMYQRVTDKEAQQRNLTQLREALASANTNIKVTRAIFEFECSPGEEPCISIDGQLLN